MVARTIVTQHLHGLRTLSRRCVAVLNSDLDGAIEVQLGHLQQRQVNAGPHA